MKAISIHQPFASLIMSGTKRVENRSWPTKHRGPLIIHASKTRASWQTGDASAFPDAVFGAALGIVNLIDCVQSADVWSGALDQQYPWLKEHEYTFGPWCWIVEVRSEFKSPIVMQGRQGLFGVTIRGQR